PEESSLAPRVAAYVDKILKGAKAGELPVEQATRFTLALNLSLAQEMGLSVPESMLVQATQVIRPAKSGPRVGVLKLNPGVVRPELQKLGWTEGENYTLEFWRPDDVALLPGDAKDLVRRGVNVLLANGT